MIQEGAPSYSNALSRTLLFGLVSTGNGPFFVARGVSLAVALAYNPVWSRADLRSAAKRDFGEDEPMSAIRIGAVSYLNSKPLVFQLEALAPHAELILDYPSRLADRLTRGELDVALIPVIEYFRAGSYRLIPNTAIVSQGPVLSVTLFSKTPWTEIRRVALDEGSRTSAALTQV